MPRDATRRAKGRVMLAGDGERNVKGERVGVRIVFRFVVGIVGVVGIGVVRFGACAVWSAFFSVKTLSSAAAVGWDRAS